MGFRPEPKLYKLTFTDPAFHGFQVTMRSIPIGRSLEIQQTQANRTGLSSVEVTCLLAEILVEHMVDWNLEDEDGNPLPISRDTMLTQDADLIWTTNKAWIEAISGVPAPLDESSTSGEPFQEASLAMELLSPSLSS